MAAKQDKGKRLSSIFRFLGKKSENNGRDDRESRPQGRRQDASCVIERETKDPATLEKTTRRFQPLTSVFSVFLAKNSGRDKDRSQSCACPLDAKARPTVTVAPNTSMTQLRRSLSPPSLKAAATTNSRARARATPSEPTRASGGMFISQARGARSRSPPLQKMIDRREETEKSSQPSMQTMPAVLPSTAEQHEVSVGLSRRMSEVTAPIKNILPEVRGIFRTPRPKSVILSSGRQVGLNDSLAAGPPLSRSSASPPHHRTPGQPLTSQRSLSILLREASRFGGGGFHKMYKGAQKLKKGLLSSPITPSPTKRAREYSREGLLLRRALKELQGEAEAVAFISLSIDCDCETLFASTLEADVHTLRRRGEQLIDRLSTLEEMHAAIAKKAALAADLLPPQSLAGMLPQQLRSQLVSSDRSVCIPSLRDRVLKIVSRRLAPDGTARLPADADDMLHMSDPLGMQTAHPLASSSDTQFKSVPALLTDYLSCRPWSTPWHAGLHNNTAGRGGGAPCAAAAPASGCGRSPQAHGASVMHVPPAVAATAFLCVMFALTVRVLHLPATTLPPCCLLAVTVCVLGDMRHAMAALLACLCALYAFHVLSTEAGPLGL
mmetsp:Transcript_22912/g.57425  ORF Transcript_22912/g.57425 Transcript_22912/m.57425 type:complete len:608 (-) Transcript_22912:138-1961(-)